MGHLIAIANQKGGVGKTTLAVHIAVGLARRSERVIAIDADPQGNLTSWLLDGDTDDGMFRLLIIGGQPINVIRPLARWELGLVPGNYRTGEAMAMLAAVGRLGEIPGRLRPFAAIADYVIVDLPPSRAPGFTELLSAADWIVIPTQLERLALEGVGLMAQAALAVQQATGARRPRLLGIVPNMTRVHTNEHQAQMDDLVDVFGPFVWPPLPLTIRVTEASSLGTTVYGLCPDDRIAQQMWLIVDRLRAAIREAGDGR